MKNANVLDRKIFRSKKFVKSLLHHHGYSNSNFSSQLKLFQAFSGLTETGKLDLATQAKLEVKRCYHEDIRLNMREHKRRFSDSNFGAPILAVEKIASFPEIKPDPTFSNKPGYPYEVIPCRWGLRDLKFCFVGGPPEYLGTGAFDAVRSAFGKWNALNIVNFSEVDSQYEAEIRVLWTLGPKFDPNSNDPFYGPGGYAAYTYYPFPHLKELCGDVHFDLGDRWTLNPDGGPGLDVETIAIHEIGHSIGIGHCALSNSTMNPVYKKKYRAITTDVAQDLARKYRDQLG